MLTGEWGEYQHLLFCNTAHCCSSLCAVFMFVFFILMSTKPAVCPQLNRSPPMEVIWGIVSTLRPWEATCCLCLQRPRGLTSSSRYKTQKWLCGAIWCTNICRLYPCMCPDRDFFLSNPVWVFLCSCRGTRWPWCSWRESTRHLKSLTWE